MDATPRLRSAFPSTPHNSRRPAPRQQLSDGSPARQRSSSRQIPDIPTLKPPANSGPPENPLIPEHVLDAPSQRLFAVSVWMLLQTWKIFDFVMLQESEEQSLWLFMKWLAIDGTFLFGLPGLRIPWLEWSPSTMTLLFCMHAFVDGMMMFRIPVPVGAGLAALGRSFWGAYELAVNEHNVNPETIKFNDSLLLGRQIIHILPEGSAILNPSHASFCINDTRPEARLPIMINSTNPIAMELLRIDLETNANETINISKSQIKTMHKEASRLLSYSDKPNEPKTLYYVVRKPGLYVLQKVVDETNLQVARKQLAHTPVVPCPRAMIMPSAPDRCKGELSDIAMEVTGTPPLRIKYRKVIDSSTQDATFENITPDDFFSPLTKQDHNSLVVPRSIDTAWARPRTIHVPLSESLSFSGKWVYSIEEVKDGFGNAVRYSSRDHRARDKTTGKSSQLHQNITVHERPTVRFNGCTPQSPLKVAKGQAANLPIKMGSSGRQLPNDALFDLEFLFSSEEDLSATGEHTHSAQQKRLTANMQKAEQVKDAGLYTITGVSTKFCRGEVLEPASCLIQNPPEPQLSITKEEISDKCAGSPIGLRVDLNLIGTPPFEIKYRITKSGDRNPLEEAVQVNGLRGQVKLTPKHAGNYKYEFYQISDAVYKRQPLKAISLEQDVKPSASARFVKKAQQKSTCIDDSASFDVELQGEGPFSLEYDVIHKGKRTKHNLNDLERNLVKVETGPLHDGGDYTLELTSITDRMGCKEFLKDEVKTSVRYQKPKVGFGQVEGVRSINILQGKEVGLPLRLAGEAPWTIKYLDKAGYEHTTTAQNPNHKIHVSGEGVYELTGLHDSECPGVIDEPAKTFEVSWIPRPELRIAPGDVTERKGNTLVRADVCEGDEDVAEVLFKGSAPFNARYIQSVKITHGTAPPKAKELRAPGNYGNLRMDTSQAGLYEYKFDKLEDNIYSHSSQHFTSLTLQQRVNARPSAAFANPGKTYSYCSVESDGEEVIPITLHGQPPFNVEIEIKHFGTSKPETVSLTSIDTHKHDIRIPHSRVSLGNSALSLRRVSDSNGCARILDSTTPRVQISVHDAPTVTELEERADFCIGERINFSLSGAAPFQVFYTFEGAARKAVASTSTFRRLAEKPGEFVITGLQDSASQCRSSTNIAKRIHGMPSARVSKGRESYVDIHEGGTAEILFEFGGVPPFEFTYTRSSNTEKGGKKAGTVLDMRSEVSDGHSMRIAAHEEGTYEVVAIKDRYCAYSKPGVKLDWKEAQRKLKF